MCLGVWICSLACCKCPCVHAYTRIDVRHMLFKLQHMGVVCDPKDRGIENNNTKPSRPAFGLAYSRAYQDCCVGLFSVWFHHAGIIIACFAHIIPELCTTTKDQACWPCKGRSSWSTSSASFWWTGEEGIVNLLQNRMAEGSTTWILGGSNLAGLSYEQSKVLEDIGHKSALSNVFSSLSVHVQHNMSKTIALWIDI